MTDRASITPPVGFLSTRYSGRRVAGTLCLTSLAAWLVACAIAVAAIVHNPLGHLEVAGFVLLFAGIIAPNFPTVAARLAAFGACAALVVVMVAGVVPNYGPLGLPFLLAVHPPRWFTIPLKAMSLPVLAGCWLMGLGIQMLVSVQPLWACSAAWWLAAITLSVLALWTYRRNPPQ